MFNFLKSTEDCERDFRAWVSEDPNVRAYGKDEWRAEWTQNVLYGSSLVGLIEENAAGIAMYFTERERMARLVGPRVDPIRDSYFWKGAKIVHALLDKKKWALAVSSEEPLHGGTIVVDSATGKRVRG